LSALKPSKPLSHPAAILSHSAEEYQDINRIIQVTLRQGHAKRPGGSPIPTVLPAKGTSIVKEHYSPSRERIPEVDEAVLRCCVVA
jgi:hypothetical protein